MMQQKVEWMNTKQIAAHLGVSKETLYRWIKAEKIPKHRIGKLWKFNPIEVDKALKRGDLL